MSNPVWYNVAPRYTPGSPALVDEATAMRVADEEKKDYETIVAGQSYVPGEEEKAKRLGLKGIVEARQESKGGWNVTDVLTGERFWRGEVKSGKLACKDRILHVDSGYVTDLTSHDGTTPAGAYPLTIERIEHNSHPNKSHPLIHCKDQYGNSAVLYCKNAVSCLFRIERSL